MDRFYAKRVIGALRHVALPAFHQACTEVQ